MNIIRLLLWIVLIIAINSCNKDDNCDEQIWYQDSDGDGFGNPEVTEQSCSEISGYVLIDGDCNDSNVLINPNSIEIAGNSVDENCDEIYEFPYSVGNKWYFEGSYYERTEDSYEYKMIYESIKKGITSQSIVYFDIKRTKIIEGRNDVIDYIVISHRQYIPKEDFEISNIFDVTLKKYNNSVNGCSELNSSCGSSTDYCFEFGLLSFYSFYENRVHILENSQSFSLKGCSPA